MGIRLGSTRIPTRSSFMGTIVGVLESLLRTVGIGGNVPKIVPSRAQDPFST